MFNFPNLLSLLRIPLAFLFIETDPFYRGLAIVLAMFSDILDGYLARKYQQTSRLGTWLDPITDKFFVMTALVVLYSEQRLFLWQAFALVSRDIALIVFAIYLASQRKLSNYSVHAILWGKVSTAFQFIVLFALVFYGALPTFFYFPFIIFGILAFLELLRSLPKNMEQS